MESVNCLFCGLDDSRPILRREVPKHVICRRCGLVYQNPRPTAAEAQAMYQSSYWEDRGVVGASDGPAEFSDRSRAQSVLEWVQSCSLSGQVVIEVGCGHGEILATLQRATGCKPLGIEPSPAQAEAARERFGLEIQSSDVASAYLPGEKARLIILSHVLEHFHDPRAALTKCRSWLQDGGFLFVEVPNILRPTAHKRLSNWLAVEHNYYFSAGTLSRLLDETRFAVSRIESDGPVRALATEIDSPVFSAWHNEYRAVRKAIARHELAYWPRRALRKLVGE